MKNIKVLMIDDNLELIQMVKEYFSDHASIDISLEAHDGIEGMKLIKEHQNDYDVVMLSAAPHLLQLITHSLCVGALTATGACSCVEA